MYAGASCTLADVAAAVALEDLPSVAVARKSALLSLRRVLANAVEAEGGLNASTKTGRSCREVGLFDGLSGLFARWQFQEQERTSEYAGGWRRGGGYRSSVTALWVQRCRSPSTSCCGILVVFCRGFIGVARMVDPLLPFRATVDPKFTIELTRAGLSQAGADRVAQARTISCLPSNPSAPRPFSCVRTVRSCNYITSEKRSHCVCLPAAAL